MPIVVSHVSPDLDSITSIWIAQRFGPFAGAELAFVEAGRTLGDLDPDERPDIIHVDTGLGRFDHHQPEVASPTVCAARLVLEAFAPHDRALARIVEYVVKVDNALLHPEDRLEPFAVTGLIHGLNLRHPDDSRSVVLAMLPLLDAWYSHVSEQVSAEHDLAGGFWFDTEWGRGVAVEERTGGAQLLAFAQGAKIYVYRSVEGWLGVTATAHSAVDLTQTAESVRQADPGIHWYLHPSRKLLLHGSRKAPARAPSGLSIDELIAIVRG